MFSVSGCTLTANDFEPSWVTAESQAGVGGAGALPAPGQTPGGSAMNPSPALDPGEAESAVDLLPADMDVDNRGDSRGPADRSAVQDAGPESAARDDAGDAGPSEREAGTSQRDAGAPPPGEPDAGATRDELDASTAPGAEDIDTPITTRPCPGLTFEGSCYEFFAEQLSWYAAEARCVAWGGHLASVESPEEDAFVGIWPALVGIAPWDGSGLWIGGTDARRDGDFRWWDDRELDFVGWAPDQPNNGQGVDCIEKRNDATQRWYDRRCTDGERYVCERPQ